MELSQHGFLEELLAPRRDFSSSWTTFSSGGVSEFFPNQWNFDSFDDHSPSLAASNPSFVGLMSSTPTLDQPSFECPFTSFVDNFTTTVPAAEIESSSYTQNHTSPFHQDHPSSVAEDDQELAGLLTTDHHHYHHHQSSFEEETKSSGCCKIKVEQATSNINVDVFNMGLCPEKKNKSKKLEGQPSKNLMAERRRRKRLNDRLSMLRSIVPKISKMDRTSILGDTIDYMKELLERINKLQEEETEMGTNNMKSLLGDFKEPKPNEVLVRNSPKFDVARRDVDTRIDICCAAKPGLLLSTVNTLEALGLEIQQCVISCFNDFSLQASCSEAAEQRPVISSEDIKQALFRNAGYGGRCL